MPTNIVPHDLVPKRIHDKAAKRVRECMKIASKKTQKNFRFEGVKFFNKSTDAGYVKTFEGNIVYLNLDLFSKYPKQYLYEIIPHEVAHIVADKIDKKTQNNKPHGETWQYVMSYVFGLFPHRCHSMDTEGIGRAQKKFVYICSCKKHLIGLLRHKKIQQGVKKYICKKCKKELVYLRKSDT